MKNVIFSQAKKNGMGIEKGNQVSVEVNRYAKGKWPVALNGYTHEYELLIDGKVAVTFRGTLNYAKKLGESTLITEWIAKNPL